MLTPDRGCISLPAFLYLAMVCFVSPKEPTEGPQQQQRSPRQQQGLISEAGRGGRRLFVRGRGDAAAAAAAAATAGVSASNDCYDSPVSTFSPPSTSTPRDSRASRTAAVGDGDGGSGSPLGVGVVGARAMENGIKIPAPVKLCLFCSALGH